MKLRQRVRLWLQAGLDDLFGEGSEGNLPHRLEAGLGFREQGEERLGGMLEEAQQRLEELRQELAQAAARQKRVELDGQAAQAQASQLSDEVDAALQTGQEELARAKLVEAQRSQKRATELGELYHACLRLSQQIGEAIQAQQEQLDTLQRKAQELAERERGAELMEEIALLQREMTSQSAALQSELSQREEQVARREDKLAARRVLDHMNRS